MRKVPTLSLGEYMHGEKTDRMRFIDNLYSGLKEYGFIILKEHEVNANLLKQAYEVMEKFYNLPTDVKMKYVSPNGGGQRGYTPYGKEHAKGAEVMDLKEFYHVGREVADDHRLAKYYPKNIM